MPRTTYIIVTAGVTAEVKNCGDSLGVSRREILQYARRDTIINEKRKVDELLLYDRTCTDLVTAQVDRHFGSKAFKVENLPPLMICVYYRTVGFG